MNKKILKKIIIIVFILLTSLAVAHFALALGTDQVGLQYGQNIGLGNTDPRMIAANVIKIALAFLGLVALCLIAYAGWLWMSANGNEEQVGKAKKIIISAAIGLIIILAAYGIVSYIMNTFLEATGTNDIGRMCNPPCSGSQPYCCAGTCQSTVCMGEGADVFKVMSTIPGGNANYVPRNVIERIFFNKKLNDSVTSAVAGDNFLLEKIGTVDSNTGTSTDTSAQKIDGQIGIGDGKNEINFQANINCEKEGVIIPHCLEAWTKYRITVNAASGIKSIGNESLDCTRPGSCSIIFSTGSGIDTGPPSISIDRGQICKLTTIPVGGINKVGAWAWDDYGISKIDFYNYKDAAGAPASTTPGNGLTTQYAFYNFDTSNPDIREGDIFNIKTTGYDMAGATSSDIYQAKIRPAHCCNGYKDADEENVDCGGADCLACVGGACNKTTPNECQANNGNCDNNLCQSFFCQCSTNNCKCQQKPIITLVTPVGGFCQNHPDVACQDGGDCPANDVCNQETANGAIGNFVTIAGRNFGSAEGQVFFSVLGSNQWLRAPLANDDTIGNPVCQKVWQDNQIIAVIPSGLNGDRLDIKVVAVSNYFDSISDNYGPRLDFVRNGILRPGLCQLNPDRGEQNANLIYSGIRLLQGTAYFGDRTSYIAAASSIFNSDRQGSAGVPNISNATTTTFIWKGKTSSNYLKFEKVGPAWQPQIIYFGPTSGSTGQYVTIRGKGFGATRGQSNVYFGAVGDNKPASFDFPVICADSIWSDNQVIIKVPSGLNDSGKYLLTMKLYNSGRTDPVVIDTSDLNPDKFTFDTSIPNLPGLCRIQPNIGQNNSPVSLWGEYFGIKDANSKVRFQNNQNQNGAAILEWGQDPAYSVAIPDKVRTTVHPQAVTGLVKIVKGNSPGLEGNGMNFKIGTCAQDQDCGTGSVCCPSSTAKKGTCQSSAGECSYRVPNCVYEWDFDTNNGIACDGNLLQPGCQKDATKCPSNLPFCDPASCMCAEAIHCDSNPLTPTCEADKKMCPSEAPFCQTSDCTCRANPYNTCSGYELNQCTNTLNCPNSPGRCSADAGQGTSAGACQSCNQLPECSGGNCELDGIKCVLKNTTCRATSTITDINGQPATAYCGAVDDNTRNPNHYSYWQIGTSLSCPLGWTKLDNNKCVNFDAATGKCNFCPSGFKCNGLGGDGKCQANTSRCPSGTSCNANGQCIRPATCECCCRGTDDHRYDAQDCCAPLKCEGTCGQGRAELPVTDSSGRTTTETVNFGLCTGCAQVGTSQADHDGACNCSGHTGKYCDSGAANGQGVCRDCAQLTSDPSQCSIHPTSCCVDNNSNNACRGGTGHTNLDSASGLAYCGYYSCSGNSYSSQCSNTLDKTGTYKEEDRSKCQQDCQGDCPGCLCKKPSYPRCNYDDPAVCMGAYQCQDKEEQDCRCCCQPTNDPAQDKCRNINTGDASLKLTCQPNKSPCTENYRGLCCGCQADSNCGDANTVGCSYDKCCRNRPYVLDEYSKSSKECNNQSARSQNADLETTCRKYPIPYNGFNNICRNALVQAKFDQFMNISSFTGNMIVAADFGTASCPNGSQYLSLDNIRYDNFWIRSYYQALRLLGYIAQPFTGRQAWADDWSNHNLCALPGLVGGYHSVDSKTYITFSPTQLLPGGKSIYVIIKGDETLTSKAGVMSLWRVGMNGPGFDDDLNASTNPVNPVSFNGKSYNRAKIWKFTTLSEQAKNNGVCVIDRVEINPEYYLFQKVEADHNENDTDVNDATFDTVKDGDKVFVAYAMTSDNQIIVPIPQIYSWNWQWNSQNTRVVTTNSIVNLGEDKSLIKANPSIKEGHTFVSAATLESGTYINNFSRTHTGTSSVWVFVCDNPWPSVNIDGTWRPWSDSTGNCLNNSGACFNTNNELYYCRDAGAPGTADDLPAILNNAVVRGNSNSANLIKEYYFLREQIPDISGVHLNAIAPAEGGKIGLMWEPVVGAASYEVYYGPGSNIYDHNVSVVSPGTSDHPYYVGGLVNGVTYYFAVTAKYLNQAESKYSNEAFSIPRDLIGPVAPRIASNAGNGKVDIIWTDLSNGDADHFAVYYGANSAPDRVYGQSINVAFASKGTTTVSNLSNGTIYKFVMVAFDDSGNRSTSTLVTSTPLP